MVASSCPLERKARFSNPAPAYSTILVTGALEGAAGGMYVTTGCTGTMSAVDDVVEIGVDGAEAEG